MTDADWLFAVDVLQTPLGPSWFHAKGSAVDVERRKVLARYEELKGQPLDFAEASRRARAEWLHDYITGKGEPPRAGVADLFSDGPVS